MTPIRLGLPVSALIITCSPHSLWQTYTGKWSVYSPNGTDVEIITLFFNERTSVGPRLDHQGCIRRRLVGLDKCIVRGAQSFSGFSSQYHFRLLGITIHVILLVRLLLINS